MQQTRKQRTTCVSVDGQSFPVSVYIQSHEKLSDSGKLHFWPFSREAFAFMEAANTLRVIMLTGIVRICTRQC